MNTAATVDMATDIAIAGGGLVGASLALALAQLSLKVTLIEASPFGVSQQPSFDDRTTALSNGSRRIFEALGVWPLIEREATAIRRIHVSDQGRFGFARINAAEQGMDALGFVATNRVMGAALWRRLQEQAVQVIAPARVTGMTLHGERQRIQCDLGANGSATIEAKLAVAADGSHSVLRQSAGIGAQTWDYRQVALVANVFAQRFHDHVAYERFTARGPLALLPLSEGRLGLIWTFDPEAAEDMLQLPDERFIDQLQQAFGFRLGRFTRVGARALYPLSLTRSDQYVAQRLAIVGNAAQSLHPIAGQGFNLGLRDAASLAEILADAHPGREARGGFRSGQGVDDRAAHPGVDRGEGHGERPEAAFDPGDRALLERYCEWRLADRRNIVRFTDGLVRLFTQPFGPAKFLRDAGMLAFDLMPVAKDALSQLSLGAAGKVPRLARGARL